MAFVCGGVLLGWSVFADRGDLWRLGMPTALGGQFSLLLGLVLQLDLLWNYHRQTDDKLVAVDTRVQDLNQTTAQLGATHSSAAQAFYSHLADSASPQILLADLKSQIDLLSVTMANRR